MELTNTQKSIYNGKICPYCGSGTKVVSEEFIYGRTYKGKSMICCNNYPTCDSYCGTHEEDGSALGRLANRDLRRVKKMAHSVFDKIWLERKYVSRNGAYDWLSDKLDIPREYCHIGWFNKETTIKVIKACNGVSQKDFKDYE